ncbi:MAG: hypothetical protein ACD_61C00026G0001 [uncultured bacterium]|nr:MAG: hypothetical protein ACD_61C00026G0001 [uncultured bacterium]
MVENGYNNGIPEEILPLYNAKTAHESFDMGLAMLRQADSEAQLKLLTNPSFVRIMQSAINGLDQCQKTHMESLVDVLDSNNQKAFFDIFE